MRLHTQSKKAIIPQTQPKHLVSIFTVDKASSMLPYQLVLRTSPCYCPPIPHAPILQPKVTYFCFAPCHQCEDFYLFLFINLFPLHYPSLFYPSSILSCHSACRSEFGHTFLIFPPIVSLSISLCLAPFSILTFLFYFFSPLPFTTKL